MPITIGSNIASLQSQRQLNKATDSLSTISERLSSGQRINHASDDAAGLAIALSLNTNARIYTQGIRNLNDGVSYLNIAQGSLTQLSAITDRQSELAEQSANGVYSLTQRKAIQNESTALSDEYNRIVDSTSFNGVKVFSRDGSTIRVQAGNGIEESLVINTANYARRNIGVNSYSSATSYEVGNDPRQMTLADVDNDGKLDLITSNYGNDGAGVMLGNGDGTFKSRITLTSPFGQFYGSIVGDFNGDGKVDIVATNQSGSEAYVYTNQGNGSFSAGVSYDIGDALSSPLKYLQALRPISQTHIHSQHK